MRVPPLHNTHGSLNYETSILAQDAVYEALLKRISEEDRAVLGSDLNSIRTMMLNSCPTVHYGMSPENLAKWQHLDGLTTRVPNTVIIVHLKLEAAEPAVFL